MIDRLTTSVAPAGRRRRQPSHRSDAGNRSRQRPQRKTRLLQQSGKISEAYSLGAVSTLVGIVTRRRRIPGSCSLVRAVQPEHTCGRSPGSWLQTTFLRLPTLNRAVAYGQHPNGHQPGGRLTNYSGGTAPDSHRISFSTRKPPSKIIGTAASEPPTGIFNPDSIVNAPTITPSSPPVKQAGGLGEIISPSVPPSPFNTPASSAATHPSRPSASAPASSRCAPF